MSEADAWRSIDDPLPDDAEQLAAEIIALAAERTRLAAEHKYWCNCLPCKMRRRKEKAEKKKAG